MKKKLLSFLLSSFVVASAYAAPETLPEKTESVEKLIYGEVQQGSLVERVQRVHQAVYGKVQHGELPTQVEFIYEAVDRSKAGMSLREKIDALQWNYEKVITKEPIITRIENMEMSIWGKHNDGNLDQREEKLEMTIIGADKALAMREVTLPKTEIVKLELREPISTKTHKEGQEFSFAVADDVVIDNVLLLAKGTVGTGHITELKKARSFGRSAKLELVFDQVETVDGVSLALEQGPEAKAFAESELKAAGTSVAGAALLGPVGLVGGFFIKGKDIDIQEGATLYVQPLAEISSFGHVMGGVAAEPKVKIVEAPTPSPVSEKKIEVKEINTENPVTAEAEIMKDEAAAKESEKEEKLTEVKADIDKNTGNIEEKKGSLEEAQSKEEIPDEPIIVIKRAK